MSRGKYLSGKIIFLRNRKINNKILPGHSEFESLSKEIKQYAEELDAIKMAKTAENDSKYEVDTKPQQETA